MKRAPLPSPPASAQGPDHGKTSVPPANCTAKKTKAPNPLGTVKDSKTKENPYTPGRKFQESNSITPPQNAMELH
ncbi:hypothetical protein C0989_007214 [Termitomyces sp. Mn162]|nr:hypothetical protein C0989_007214 [Termitomyces sp. Mn162]